MLIAHAICHADCKVYNVRGEGNTKSHLVHESKLEYARTCWEGNTKSNFMRERTVRMFAKKLVHNEPVINLILQQLNCKMIRNAN